jgi:nucleotide-binding universal stress UspA family protein
MATTKKGRRSSTRLRPQSQRPVAPSTTPRIARPVLVATDGSKAAQAAIKFVRAMEEAGSWKPEAMTVVEHLPVAVADVALPMPVVITEPTLVEGPVNVVRRQLSRLGARAWPFRSELGPAADNIIEVAKLHGSEIIVLGLGKHGKLARLFGAETAARVCRRSPAPVLAVDPHAKAPPKSIVVAMDFGSSSVRAAREAIDLLSDGGRLHLVHVRWALDGKPLRDEAWERTYAMGVEQGFVHLLPQLVRPGVKVTSEMKLGGILETLLKVIKDRKADVIAVGSHSQNVVDRLLLGSTAANLLRAAKCSVLVAPPG